MNVLEGLVVLCIPGHKPGNHLVHLPGPQGAPEAHHQRPVIQSQLPPCLLPSGKEEFTAHRHTHHPNLLGMGIVFPAFLKGYHYPVHLIHHQPGGETGYRVGLMERRGNLMLGPLPQHGIAGIAAGAHNHVRLKLPDDPIGASPAADHVAQGLYIMDNALWTELPLKVGDLNRLQPEARPGHQIGLHAVLRAHKQDVRLGMALFQQTGHGQCRADMSRRTAAGKNHIHIRHDLISCYRKPAEHCREAPKMIPISPS